MSLSEGYGIPLSKVEELLIQLLRIEHPGALPISIDWDTRVEKCAAIIWWVPSSETTDKPSKINPPNPLDTSPKP